METKKFYKNRHILITGGLGFIGSNLAIKLANVGAKVIILDALLPSFGGNIFNISPIKNEVKIIIGDMRDEKTIKKVVRDKQIIFNLAGTLSHIDSMTNPFEDLDINCRAQLCLLEACRKYSRDVKIVFAGTRNQYGKALYLPVDEKHNQEPTDINGINSIAAEKYHLLYCRIYGIKTVSLRMSNTFGPRHQMKHSRQGVLNWFIRMLLEGQEVKLYGTGNQIRDVNYIDYVVEALYLTGRSEKGWGEAYNLGGIPVSLSEFVKTAVKTAKMGRVSVVPFPEEREKIEIGDYIASYEKIKKTYGWAPKTKLTEGIEKTIGYYLKYRNKYW